ncbi:MAG TPA: tyrosine-protein kinase family protein [Methylothermaceae bacterium]|nr:tyrosine-protein kinase family protein [Methylothermaceae bacterium]
MSTIEKAIEKEEAGKSGAGQPKEETAVPPPPTQRYVPTGKPHIRVDVDRLKELGMLAPDAAHGQLAEEFRIIKRPILANAFGQGAQEIQNANLILVTSSLPGEGKTFTAVNLALSIAAERDKTVLLVDADVVKPTTSKLMGVGDRAGLIDILERKVTMQDVLLRTDIPSKDTPKLTVLPAGRRHPHATELLASEEMQRLAQDMSRRYPDRVIVFDSPPLLATTQASVLATHVGQVLLVVEAEATPQYIVKEAVDMLAGCQTVGCVLNKTNQGFGLGYYAYYGYKYYNYGEN